MDIPISEAKKIRERIGADRMVIFAIDSDGDICVATHGKTIVDARASAEMGNELKRLLKWPEELRRSTPLPRIHMNCAYFHEFFGNIWCNLEPKRIELHDSTSPACRHFEPKDEI